MTSPECDAVKAVMQQGTSTGLVVDVEDAIAVSSRVCAVEETRASYEMYFVDELRNGTTVTVMADGDTYDYRTSQVGTARVAGECSLSVGMEPWSQVVMVDAALAPLNDQYVPVWKGAYLSLRAGASSYPTMCTLQFSPTFAFLPLATDEEDEDDDDSYSGMDAGAILAVFLSLFAIVGLAEAFYLGLFPPLRHPNEQPRTTHR